MWITGFVWKATFRMIFLKQRCNLELCKQQAFHDPPGCRDTDRFYEKADECCKIKLRLSWIPRSPECSAAVAVCQHQNAVPVLYQSVPLLSEILCVSSAGGMAEEMFLFQFYLIKTLLQPLFTKNVLQSCKFLSAQSSCLLKKCIIET